LETLRDLGAEPVPGIGRIGGAVSADCFHALGIGAGDIAFLGRLAVSAE